jgi:ABC-type sugar transport system ATPase subunit
LTLGDRIAVLKEGVLQQMATPMGLYDTPANKFVAGFIGTPAMNFLPGTLTRRGTSAMCSFTGRAVTMAVVCGEPNAENVVLGIRPQDVEIGDGSRDGSIAAEVAVVEPMGNEQIVYVTLRSGERLVAVAPVQPRIKAGENVTLVLKPQGVHLFDAATGARILNR